MRRRSFSCRLEMARVEIPNRRSSQHVSPMDSSAAMVAAPCGMATANNRSMAKAFMANHTPSDTRTIIRSSTGYLYG